jgi:glycosyltransferase involved in cell wall biosynthesis
MTSANFIAFTADDEASLHQLSLSPLYWLRRIWIRHSFAKHVKLYKYYFTFSKEQAEDYSKEYKLPTSTLYKCGDFPDTFCEKSIGKPIQMVYAGRLYCERWRTLGKIGEALRLINKDGVKVILNIYSQENLTSSQKCVLNESNYIYFRGSVTASELADIYRKSDIALHVETFEKKYAYATRVSFSTKIIDLMASTCAIMAICWERHAGYQYLKENDAAFCINSYDDILPMIEYIVDNPQMVAQMARKAWECGMKHHKRENIQQQLKTVFNKYSR